MRWLLLLAFLFQQSDSRLADLPRPGALQPVTPVSFGGKEIIETFNATADRTRLVLVFSPT